MKAIVSFERVQKIIKKIPHHIKEKALDWAEDVEENGLLEVRKRPGFHDEPLKGSRAGQRSVRLSRSYRLIYVEIEGIVVVVKVLEINKHDY